MVRADDPELAHAIEKVIEKKQKDDELRANAGKWVGLTMWWYKWWRKLGAVLLAIAAARVGEELLKLAAHLH
jgi:hypothetical protein